MPGNSDLSEGERSVLVLHPHWKTVVWPVVLLVIVVVAASVLLIVIPHNRLQGDERIAVGAVALLAAVIWTGVPFLRWRTTTYELTTRRFRQRYGILTRTGRDFPLVRISDISYSAGPVDRLLGTGRLIIESAGEHGQLVLNEIPDVQTVQATLFQLVEDEHARLAKEDRGPG
jgi:membrane protein YdbS with pleckstrin-like domain